MPIKQATTEQARMQYGAFIESVNTKISQMLNAWEASLGGQAGCGEEVALMAQEEEIALSIALVEALRGKALALKCHRALCLIEEAYGANSLGNGA